MGTRIELGRLARAALIMATAACASAGPASPAAPAPAERPPITRTEPVFRLPVEGVWIVSQGYHGAESHRGRAAYALDLVKLADDGQAYVRTGRHLSDWHSFGAEVVASADGVVVRARDHFADNPVMGRARNTNTVIVQHGDVYSEYVHLQRGSLRVREGERVTRGQVLARAGNSGAETPHLHWALLSSFEPIRTRAATLAYEALDDAGSWQAASGAPAQNERIRPAAE